MTRRGKGCCARSVCERHKMNGRRLLALGKATRGGHGDSNGSGTVEMTENC